MGRKIPLESRDYVPTRCVPFRMKIPPKKILKTSILGPKIKDLCSLKQKIGISKHKSHKSQNLVSRVQQTGDFI